jgi:hypothetical protein
MSDKLKTLMSKCECSVYLRINDHRNIYKSAIEALEEAQHYECPPEIDSAVRQRMIETNTIIELQFYPHTPISSYDIWHYDLDAALDIALSCFD